MSDFYVWNAAELGINVNEMDRAHQELIRLMNVFYHAAETKKSSAEILSAIQALGAYTVKHFTEEEAYMEKIGFAGIGTHKVIHKKLLERFNHFTDEYKKHSKVDPEFFLFLKNWLTSHIRGIDKKYAEFSHGSKSA